MTWTIKSIIIVTGDNISTAFNLLEELVDITKSQRKAHSESLIVLLISTLLAQ